MAAKGAAMVMTHLALGSVVRVADYLENGLGIRCRDGKF